MALIRRRYCLNFPYNIQNTILEHSNDLILDFGFKLTSNIDSGSHIEMIMINHWKFLILLCNNFFKNKLSLKVPSVYLCIVCWNINVLHEILTQIHFKVPQCQSDIIFYFYFNHILTNNMLNETIFIMTFTNLFYQCWPFF